MDVVAAVSDPVRRRLLELLLAGDRPAGELAEAFDVSRPAVSRHLRVLRDAGLVRADVVGRHRVYVLRRAPLVELDEWLGRFRPLVEPEAGAAGDAAGPVAGPAARLDALGTELRRGRRARAQERSRDGHHTDSAAG